MMVQAAVVVAPGKLELQSFPRPQISAEAALLKVEMVGVCGSDPKYFNGRISAPFPLILGQALMLVAGDMEAEQPIKVVLMPNS